MANLKSFVWCDAHSGMDVDVYLNRWPQVGGGRMNAVEELRLDVSLDIRFDFPWHFAWSGRIEVLMPDLSPRGTCRVRVHGGAEYACAYRTANCALEINTPAGTVKLSAHDNKWSWFEIRGSLPFWLGLWPRDALLAEEDVFSPAEAEPAGVA
jgi:hypothetical protein